ncbi:MAG TPA: glycosyltransferase, partial [bacterium]|nr:glycosyltransferase [bacterium]
MKILYVSNGNIVYDLKFIKKMLEYNYIVGWVRFNIVNEEELKKISKIENLKIYYLKFPRLNNYFSNKINQISTNIFRVRLDDYLIVKDLKKIIYEFNPDILYGGWVMYEGYFCAKVNFHPFLLMPWGTDILIEPFKKINKFKRIRWTIQKADMITCDCEYQKEYVCKIGQYPEEKVITFPWGIDLKIFYKRRN